MLALMLERVLMILERCTFLDLLNEINEEFILIFGLRAAFHIFRYSFAHGIHCLARACHFGKFIIKFRQAHRPDGLDSYFHLDILTLQRFQILVFRAFLPDTLYVAWLEADKFGCKPLIGPFSIALFLMDKGREAGAIQFSRVGLYIPQTFRKATDSQLPPPPLMQAA